MNNLLIFFALPIAVIIISIALQRILRWPALVAAVIFAIFLIVTFVISNLNFLVATIVYTIISYITAVIVCLICRFLRNRKTCNCCQCSCNNTQPTNTNNELLTISSNSLNSNNGNLLTISSNGCNGVTNDLLTVNSNCMSNNQDNGNNDNNCNCSNNDNNVVSARINVIPNSNNGNMGAFSGCYRRR